MPSGDQLADPITDDAMADAGWGALTVALQPIFEADGGALFGMEALVRGWREAGYDDPHALFDAAAAAGRLADLEFSQVEKALKVVASLERAAPTRLFVNLDTRILAGESSFFDRLEALLAQMGRSKNLVVIELSERHDKTAVPDVQRRINWVGERGFKLALDDFGNGVSDFRALHSFDVDYLKIDRFFVDGAASDAKKRFLLGRMIEMAHLLGQKVICEGIEEQADFKTARDLGSDLVQGYLFARPAVGLTEMPRAYASPIDLRRRRNDKGAAHSIRREMLTTPPLHVSERLSKAVERFADPDHPVVVPIIGDQDEPLGMLRERDLRPYMHSPYGIDLIRNPNDIVTIEGLMRRYPLANVETDPDRMMELVVGSGADGVMITAGVRYIGYVPAEALIKLGADKRLAVAQDANPLTRLPGNRAADGFLSEAVDATDRDRFICYFDFNNFKPFNDAYGFRTGDRAILLFSDIIKKEFDETRWRLSHIGGDDFFVGSLEVDREAGEKLVSTAQARFRLEAESFYTAEDRNAGGIVAKGRDGVRRRFPMLSCSAGVVTIPAGVRVPGPDALAERISEVKKRSKRAAAHLAMAEIADVSPGAEGETDDGFALTA